MSITAYLSLPCGMAATQMTNYIHGDDNLDYETNVAIVLAVQEFITDSDRL